MLTGAYVAGDNNNDLLIYNNNYMAHSDCY